MAGITDLLTQATNGSRPSPTQVTSIRVGGGTTLQANALTGWPTATAVHFITYKIDTSGNKLAGTQLDLKGVVSGTQITNVAVKAGTDNGNAIGDVIEAAPTAAWANDVVAWGTAQHNQDGTHAAITATSVSSPGVINASGQGLLQDASVPMSTYRQDSGFDFVASGGVWTADAAGSTRNASMTAIVVWINGQRLSVSAVSGRSFTASKDTYIDILNTAGAGSVVYTEVTNNAASPALASNSLRIGIIITGASNIANAGSVNQGQETMLLPIASSTPYAVTDSLGNLICGRDPNRKILGMRIVSSSQGFTTSASDVTGLSLVVNIPTGRKITVTGGFGGAFNGGTNGGNMVIRDVTAGVEIAEDNVAPGSGIAFALRPAISCTPAGFGPRTYKLTANAVTAGTLQSNVGASNPGYIKVELA